MNIKPMAIGLLFGVGMALALKSWLLGIMFGIIFYVAINETEKKKLTKWNTSVQIKKGHLNFTDDPFCLLIGKDYLFKIDQVESQSFDPNAPLKLTCSKNPSDGTVSTSSKAEPPDFGK